MTVRAAVIEHLTACEDSVSVARLLNGPATNVASLLLIITVYPSNAIGRWPAPSRIAKAHNNNYDDDSYVHY